MKVVLIAAITADGFIARHGTHAADWTGGADKKLFVRVTKELGTIVMGSRTFATIGRALPGRRNLVYTSRPKSITAEGVETTVESPAGLIKRLAREGATGLAVCGGAQIYTQFMQSGLVNELYLTTISTLFGTGVPLFNDSLDAKLKLLSSEPLADNMGIVHHYTVLH